MTQETTTPKVDIPEAPTGDPVPPAPPVPDESGEVDGKPVPRPRPDDDGEEDPDA